ncbi:ABC transporter ATP-binding protein [Pleomorphovibrio marinus]|uniref:ABC transporter ATP-binding protein n=1 Tax=Pleomorphovibrio marinus TaxID=2164132 RepID=UPI000E0B7DBC|nr:ABC transporter ATP-binding protein [Pleomorphovibrio marinus]
MEQVIELVNLTKQYGEFKAVDNLSLSIQKGEVFGLLGPNGAGKSTTILMMLGLTEPSSGSVKVCGLDATKQPVEVKRKVGYLPEDVGFYDELSGFENLLFTARLNGQSDKLAYGKTSELLNKVGLGPHAEKKVSKYSRGMRQRLGLADVLVKDPEVIILDEPTLGIDPKGVKELLELIVRLSKEKGLTVLLSSHHLHQVQQICTRVGLFVSGKLIASGDVESLSSQLISKHPFLIEARVGGIQEEVDNDKLKEKLNLVPGVKEINLLAEGLLHIGCSMDRTSEIAQAIVASGAQLTHLSKKTYGLDDIYQRYFENTTSHEVHQSS